jgi:hypothetical protein
MLSTIMVEVIGQSKRNKKVVRAVCLLSNLESERDFFQNWRQGYGYSLPPTSGAPKRWTSNYFAYVTILYDSCIRKVSHYDEHVNGSI